jgi:hypothetical protein
VEWAVGFGHFPDEKAFMNRTPDYGLVRNHNLGNCIITSCVNLFCLIFDPLETVTVEIEVFHPAWSDGVCAKGQESLTDGE